MPELIQVLKSIGKREDDNRKFLASLQGVDLGEEEVADNGTSSFEEVRMRALGINGLPNDIIGLRGDAATRKGFGINEGLGYSEE